MRIKHQELEISNYTQNIHIGIERRKALNYMASEATS